MMPSPPVPRFSLNLQHVLPISSQPRQGDPNSFCALDFIRTEISDKLTFPDEGVPHTFSYNDLEEHGHLGAGTFGSVTKMLHPGLKRQMAVKRVRLITNHANEFESSKSLQRLKIEVEATRKASGCDQVVSFYGVTFHEGDCCVCMELMDVNLDTLYKAVHKSLPEGEVFSEAVLGAIAVSTVKALDHLKMHMQIIHRDVKPSNILANRSGQIKLCDFGISTYLVNSVARTYDAGCKPYMAPEKFTVSQAGYDIRSDVWSLGITMVEVATGVFPYKNLHTLPVFAQLTLIVEGEAPMLKDTTYDVSTLNFVNSCLVKDVNNRSTFKMLKQMRFYTTYSDLAALSKDVASYVELALQPEPSENK